MLVWTLNWRRSNYSIILHQHEPIHNLQHYSFVTRDCVCTMLAHLITHEIVFKTYNYNNIPRAIQLLYVVYSQYNSILYKRVYSSNARVCMMHYYCWEMLLVWYSFTVEKCCWCDTVLLLRNVDWCAFKTL